MPKRKAEDMDSEDEGEGSFLDPDTVSVHLDCSICTDVISDPQRAPCGHSFCRKCITTWLRNSKTCPVDRKPVQPSQLHHDFTLENIIGAQMLFASKLKQREKLRNKIKEKKERQKEEQRLQKEKEEEEKRQELLEKERQKEDQKEEAKAEKERLKQEETAAIPFALRLNESKPSEQKIAETSVKYKVVTHAARPRKRAKRRQNKIWKATPEQHGRGPGGFFGGADCGGYGGGGDYIFFDDYSCGGWNDFSGGYSGSGNGFIYPSYDFGGYIHQYDPVYGYGGYGGGWGEYDQGYYGYSGGYDYSDSNQTLSGYDYSDSNQTLSGYDYSDGWGGYDQSGYGWQLSGYGEAPAPKRRRGSDRGYRPY